MIRGRIFSEMIRIQPRKSELQPGRPPEFEPNRREKGPEWGLDASTENPPQSLL